MESRGRPVQVREANLLGWGDSASLIYELIYRQPIVQNPRREIAIGIGVCRRESDTSLLGKDFPLSPLADAWGRTRVAALRLFQDFTQRGERGLGGAIAVQSGSGSIWRYGEQQRP